MFLESARISRTWLRVTWLDPLQLLPHSLASVAKRQRTWSLSGSATGIRIFWGQPRWNRITGKVAEIGEELICPVSVRLVRSTVVERNHSLPRESRDGQQHPEKLKTRPVQRSVESCTTVDRESARKSVSDVKWSGKVITESLNDRMIWSLSCKSNVKVPGLGGIP